MYVRVTYPKYKAWDSNGVLAVGYEVYAYEPGGSTPTDTYSDRNLTPPANPWPVVLDSVGEADIYVAGTVKLVFTIPGGDPTSPIWSVDYYGEQEPSIAFFVGTCAPASMVDNNYLLTVSPAPSVLTQNLMLLMTPDQDNLDTLVSQAFTGAGINDGVFTGPYVGTIPGAVFTAEIDSTFMSAPDAPTAVLSGNAGIVTAGNHTVKVTFVTATGETLAGTASATVTADGSHKIDLSDIPTGNAEVTARNIYMNKAAGSTWYLVSNGKPTLNDNTTAIYSINVADATLGTGNYVAAPATNTTGVSGADSFKWKKDGGAWVTKVPITGLAQTLIDGMKIKFSEIVGHTFGNSWAVTVMTPARLDFCSFGNPLIYKNVAGVLQALDGGDMVADFPATLVYSELQTCWILNNPSLPVLASLQPLRKRKEITAEYDVVTADDGYELSCDGTFAVNLPVCADALDFFVYVTNKGTDVITVTAHGAEKIYSAQNMAGNTTFALNPGEIFTAQFWSNSVDWHVTTTSLALYKIKGFYSNVYLRNNAVTPATKIDMSADAVALLDSGGVLKVINDLSVTIDGGVVGANGLDTGSLTNDHWYYPFAIAKPDGEKAGLFSLSSTAPALPQEYTFFKVLSAIYYTGDSFALIRQVGDKVSYLTPLNLYNPFTASIPPTAKLASFATYGVTTPTLEWYAGNHHAVSLGETDYIGDYMLDPDDPQGLYLDGAGGAFYVVDYTLRI